MKKARYDGPSGTGVDLTISFPDGQYRRVHVDQGHQLPTEVDGLTVPASFRDALIKRGDWAEVNVNTDPPDPPKSADKSTKTDPAPAEKE